MTQRRWMRERSRRRRARGQLIPAIFDPTLPIDLASINAVLEHDARNASECPDTLTLSPANTRELFAHLARSRA